MALSKELREAVPAAEAVVSTNAGGEVLKIRAGAAFDAMTYLRNRTDEPFNQLMDLTCVDRVATDRIFEVVYQLRSLDTGRRLMVKASVAQDDPRIASVASIWKSANWGEREAYDMFGVCFEGHPDLRRILLYEEFEGHPLRKSYSYLKRQPLVEERDPIANPWPAKDLEPR